MTNSTLYIVGSVLSGSIVTGALTVAWRLGRLSQKIDDLVDRFDRHETAHNINSWPTEAVRRR